MSTDITNTIFAFVNNHVNHVLITLCCNDVVNENFHYNYYINRPSLQFFSSLRSSPFFILHFLAFFSFDSGDKKARHDITGKVREKTIPRHTVPIRLYLINRHIDISRHP